MRAGVRITLKVAKKGDVQADFAFFDAKPDDFHGVKKKTKITEFMASILLLTCRDKSNKFSSLGDEFTPLRSSGEPLLLLSVQLKPLLKKQESNCIFWKRVGLDGSRSTFQLDVPDTMPVVKTLCGLDIIYIYKSYRMLPLNLVAWNPSSTLRLRPAQKCVEARDLLDPIRVVAQVLIYPFFIENGLNGEYLEDPVIFDDEPGNGGPGEELCL
ncbi:hypothetical protein Tco_0474833 [Tanacetum coccineum]